MQRDLLDAEMELFQRQQDGSSETAEIQKKVTTTTKKNEEKNEYCLGLRESKPLPSSVAELPFFLVFFPAPTSALE